MGTLGTEGMGDSSSPEAIAVALRALHAFLHARRGLCTPTGVCTKSCTLVKAHTSHPCAGLWHVCVHLHALVHAHTCVLVHSCAHPDTRGDGNAAFDSAQHYSTRRRCREAPLRFGAVLGPLLPGSSSERSVRSHPTGGTSALTALPRRPDSPCWPRRNPTAAHSPMGNPTGSTQP